MNIPKIAYYSVNENNQTNATLSLRELCLRDEFDLEDVFYAVRDAIDAEDLLQRFTRICCDQIEFDIETHLYIRFKVTDVYGNTNYLKFRKKRGPNNGT